MAIKVKKRVAPPVSADPAQPGQLEEVTQDTFEWINTYYREILIGLAAVVIVLVGGSFAVEAWKERHVSPSQEVFSALQAHALALAGEGTLAEVAGQAAAARRELGSASAAEPATWVLASLQLATGERQEARAAYEAMARATNTEVQVVGTLGLAAARAAAGELDGAIQTLDGMATGEGGPAVAAALLRARLVDTYGSSSAALAAYRSFTTRFPDARERDAALQRQQQLELLLEQDPAAP